MGLDLDERAVVANALLMSLDEEEVDEIDPALLAVVQRRLAEMRSGEVESVDADEHYARLKAELTS